MILFLLFLLASLPVFLYIFWYLNLIRFKYVEKIPGPPQYPIVGNFFEFGQTIVEIFNALVRLNNNYGPVVRVWLGPTRLNVIISDPKYLEYFLSSNVHIRKGVGYEGFKAWIGNGLITSHGDLWKRHRKIITPTFHFQILEKHANVFNSCGKILIERLKEEAGKGSFDVAPLIGVYAFDVICESSMSLKVNAQSNKNLEYVEAVLDFLEVFMEKFFSIFESLKFYYRFTSNYKKEQKNLKILRDMTSRVVQNRKREVITDILDNKNSEDFGIKKKNTFLDELLDIKSGDGPFSDQEINDEVNTFLFTGHHTIASAISFALFTFAKHPEVQETILQEVYDVIGKSKDEFITFQHTYELNYLDRCIKEILRLYPSAPFVERQLEEDVSFGEYKFPKGTNLVIFIHGVHHSEEYYPNPEKFDPDRFLPENTKERHPFAYIPFSAGPRNCIGFRFALTEIKTTLAHIVRNFEILPVTPEHKPILANDAVLRSVNGLPIKLKIRDN